MRSYCDSRGDFSVSALISERTTGCGDDAGAEFGDYLEQRRMQFLIPSSSIARENWVRALGENIPQFRALKFYRSGYNTT